MHDLYLIIKNLDQKGYRSIRKNLLHYGKRRLENNKMDDLFVFLYKRESCPTRIDCAQHIWGVSKTPQLRILKSKLKSRILQFLPHELNIQRRDKYDDFIRQELKLRMKLNELVYLLRTAGTDSTSINLLESILEKSRKYEFYSLQLEALNFKKYMKGICKGKADFEKVRKEIDHVSAAQAAVSRAHDLYYELIMWEGFNGKTDIKEIQLFLRNSISELNSLFERNKSLNLLFYLKLLEIAYFQNSNSYSAAADSCEEFLKHLQTNTVNYQKSKVGVMMGNLSRCQLMSLQFSKAEANAIATLQYFDENALNYLIAQEQVFYPLFYQKKLDNALQLLLEMKTRLQNRSDFRNAQYQFFEACIHFLSGDYKKSISCIRENLEISKDKIGWGLAIRLLRLMCFVEMGKTDQAVSEIENFRKHLERHGHSVLNQRERVILRLLRLLEKQGFRLEKLGAGEKKLLTMLASRGTSYSWEPLMPELVPFHQWVSDHFDRRNVNSISSSKAKLIDPPFV